MAYKPEELDRMGPSQLLDSLELAALGVRGGSNGALEYYRAIRLELKRRMGDDSAAPGALELWLEGGKRQ